MEQLVTLSHNLSVVAVQVLLQSTVVIAVGLLVCLAFRNRSPVLQNLLCRWTLVALLITPVAVIIMRQAPTPRYAITLPLDTSALHHEVGAAVPVEPAAIPSGSSSAGADAGGMPQQPPEHDHVTSPADPAQESFRPADIPKKPEAGPRSSPIQAPTREMNSLASNAWIMYVVIMAVWVLLMLAGVFRLIIAVRKLRFMIRTAVPAEPVLRQMVDSHARRMGLKPPPILRSPFAHSPFLAGVLKPVIMAPDYLTVTDDIILHELIHLRRHDVFWSLAGHLMSIMFPIQPLVHVLISIMEDTNDLICDSSVVEHLRNPRTYATRLLSLAALMCPGYTKDSLGLGLLPSGKSLKHRIVRILACRPDIASPIRKYLLLAGGLTVVACSILTGYIDVRGEELPSLFMRRFVFMNTLNFAPAAKHIIQAAKEVLDVAVGGDDTSRELSGGIALNGNAPAFDESKTESALEQPDFETAREQSVDTQASFLAAMNADTEAHPSEPHPSQAYAERPPAAAPVADAVNIPLETVEEFVAGYDVMAELMNRGAAASPGFGAAGGVGIPGAPRAIAEFSAAKPVNVTCDYDYSAVSSVSSKEDLEQLEYFRSLDKQKQEVAWSPNSVLLAFTDNNRIWVVSIDGGEPVLVYEYKQNGHLVGAISDLCFTPDGSEIVFTKNVYDPALGSVITIIERDGYSAFYSFSNPVPNIESVNLETGEHRVLVEEAYMGTLSRDGSCMFYIRFDPAVYRSQPDELHNLPMLIDFGTGERKVLTMQHLRFGRPTFSPDDTHVILPCYSYGQPEQLFRLNLSGGDPIPVTTWELWAPDGRNIRTPAFDPSGRWILYTDATWHADGPDQSLWVYSTVTGQQYPLFDDCQYDQMGASWSYDGTSYCFIRRVDDTNYLYVMKFVVPEAEKDVIRDIDRPLAFELGQNYPNPFNIQTTIDFSIPEPGDVTLTLYSITGQKVRTLVDGSLDAGRHSIVWDGRDDFGMEVATGTYLSLLTHNGGSRRGKMTLLK